MDTSISDSLKKIRLIESQQINELTTAPIKAAAKGLGRFIPGLGLAAGAYDAYGRAKQGDWTGAALSGLGGAASLIPGIGTAASVGLAGIQAGRDKARTGSWMPDDDEVAAAVAKDKAAGAPVPAATTPTTAPTAQPVTQMQTGKNPKVLALQQKLIAKGANIKADGIMGPQTQAAMKQFPDVQLSGKINKNKGMVMSESEKISALKARLEQIENQTINEGPLGKAVWGLGQKAAGAMSNLGQQAKSFGSAVKTGFSNPSYSKVAGVASRGPNKGQVVNKASNLGAKTGSALNTGAKVGAGAAAGAAAGYFTGKPGAAKPTAITGLTPEEVKELNQLAASLENSMDPADIELMGQYNATINRIQK